LSKEKPDLLLVASDTVTVMSAALAAFYQKVPVGHVERACAQTDRYNPFPKKCPAPDRQICHPALCSTALAVENLRREGITEHVYMTGNTVIDALLDTASRLKEDYIDKTFLVRPILDKYKSFSLPRHRPRKLGPGPGRNRPRPASRSSIHFPM